MNCNTSQQKKKCAVFKYLRENKCKKPTNNQRHYWLKKLFSMRKIKSLKSVTLNLSKLMMLPASNTYNVYDIRPMSSLLLYFKFWICRCLVAVRNRYITKHFNTNGEAKKKKSSLNHLFAASESKNCLF